MITKPSLCRQRVTLAASSRSIACTVTRRTDAASRANHAQSATAVLSRQQVRTARCTRAFTAAASSTPARPSGKSSAPLTPGTRTVPLHTPLPLSMPGGSSALAAPVQLNYFDSAWEDLDGRDVALRKPVVLIMPSMSHSALVTRGEQTRRSAEAADVASSGTRPAASVSVRGWWEGVVGRGPSFGIDLTTFRVLAASPLGTPYGSTSPLTADPSRADGCAYRASFPIITPLDQARLFAMMLDELGIERVHAVVGASMGGMQALQFARLYPERYSRVAALCTTPQTSSSTQALRAVQRSAVRTDPAFNSGNYADSPPDASGAPAGPMRGMAIARMFGTICYRSREEFDARFDHRPRAQWLADRQAHANGHAMPTTLPPSASPLAIAAAASPPLFEVESYLRHQASTFTGRYDANCYLTLSTSMDLMDMAQPERPTSAATPDAAHHSAPTLEHACASIPRSAQFLLLPVSSDALIPSRELERLGALLGSQGKRVHCEAVHSILGHDAFLKDDATFSPRLRAFLDPAEEDGVQAVRRYVNSVHDL